MNYNKNFEKYYNELFQLNYYLSDNNLPFDYRYGAIVGKYSEKDKELIDIISHEYSDHEIVSAVKNNISSEISKHKNKVNPDYIDDFKIESYEKQLVLLENMNLNEWIKEYFIVNFKVLNFHIEPKHIRGLCYVYYDYLNFQNEIKSIYNPDICNLKEIYLTKNRKDSQFQKYGLVEMDDNCEMMAIDPPRFYDKSINKTIHLVNVPKELLEIFINMRINNLYNRISLRGSNVCTDILDGKNDLESVMEAMEFGIPFSIENFENMSLTRLYSKDYNDALWIKIDETDMTFEELCRNEDNYNDSIITQVVHLQYKKDNANIIITHIDHEFIFYTPDEYALRKRNASIKGTDLKRLKSFKIDDAKIPVDYICNRHINIYNLEKPESHHEGVPFLIFVLKSYFKHKDLIDEYFVGLLSK